MVYSQWHGQKWIMCYRVQPTLRVTSPLCRALVWSSTGHATTMTSCCVCAWWTLKTAPGLEASRSTNQSPSTSTWGEPGVLIHTFRCLCTWFILLKVPAGIIKNLDTHLGFNVMSYLSIFIGKRYFNTSFLSLMNSFYDIIFCNWLSVIYSFIKSPDVI